MFPAYAGNTIRGALGEGLRGIEEAALFRPVPAAQSGFREPPRPFVIRAHHLNGTSLKAGTEFWFDVHTFDAPGAAFQSFLAVFVAWSGTGIGKKRSRVRLIDIDSSEFGVDLSGAGKWPEVNGIALRFETPTELKGAGGIVKQPEFPVLFARLRERIAALALFYGDVGDLFARSADLGRCASDVSLCEWKGDWVRAERRSSRTGQVHAIGGFVGRAVYAGNLGPFMKWLEAGYWTGIGRHTAWGNGMVAVEKYVPAEAGTN